MSAVLQQARLNLDQVYPGCKIIVLVAQSGGGKSRHVQEFYADDPRLGRIVSITDRLPRDNDPVGEYRYLKRQEFDALLASDSFAWTASPYGTNCYGTLKSDINAALHAKFPTAMHVELDTAFKLLAYGGAAVYPFFLTVPPQQRFARIKTRDAELPPEHHRQRFNGDQDWPERALHSRYRFHIINNSDGRFMEAKAEMIEILYNPPRV